MLILYTWGAESLGYPGVIHGMFPRGGAELVQHFYVNCNHELTRILKEQTEKGDKSRYNRSNCKCSIKLFVLKLVIIRVVRFQDGK